MKKSKMALVWLCSVLLFTMTFLPPLYSQSNESPSKSIKVRVIKENAEFKLNPSPDSPIIRNLPMGVSLDLIEKVGDYMKVKLPPDKDGLIYTGYIRIDFIEVELDTIPSAKPPEQNIIEPTIPTKSPIPSKVSPSTIDYTDWKIKIDKAKETRSTGIGFLIGGAFTLVLAAITSNNPDSIFSGTSVLITGSLFALVGTVMWVSSADTVNELEEKGRKQGYLVKINILPTYKQKTAGIQISCSVAF